MDNAPMTATTTTTGNDADDLREALTPLQILALREQVQAVRNPPQPQPPLPLSDAIDIVVVEGQQPPPPPPPQKKKNSQEQEQHKDGATAATEAEAPTPSTDAADGAPRFSTSLFGTIVRRGSAGSSKSVEAPTKPYHRSHAAHHERQLNKRAGSRPTEDSVATDMPNGDSAASGARKTLVAFDTTAAATTTSSDKLAQKEPSNLNICPICQKTLPRPVETQTLQIRSLKPRFLRELKRVYPYLQFHPSQRICIKDLHIALQSRIEQLLEEDQTELSRLLDDAMRNLGEYEAQESTWQKQFESGWTFGERAADLVARFGGSWKFIGCLIAVLLSWAAANLILGNLTSVTPWDPYPFILLNLFLSMLAALQAPIIMMSQNRQSQIDRSQSDFVNKIILRAEHQVRHVNAKLDHLLSHQWKRLLEIQEIQIDLLQNLQLQNRRLTAPQTPLISSIPMPTPTDALMLPTPAAPLPPSNTAATPLPTGVSTAKQIVWTVETIRDDHLHMLLSHHFGTPKSDIDDTLIFAHWHTDGDNFVGSVENVSFELRNGTSAAGVLKRVCYDITFIDPTATLDDIFSGEGSVTLRNDFDTPHMNLAGRLVKLVIYPKDKPPLTFVNGDLPPRYKPTFFLKRIDKITDFFRQPIQRVNLTYTPPHQVAVLNLTARQRLNRIKIDFYPSAGVRRAQVYARRISTAPTSPAPGAGVGGLGALPIIENHHHRHNSNSINNHSHSSSRSRSPAPHAAAHHDGGSYLSDVFGPRPLSENWRPLAHASWESGTGGAGGGGPGGVASVSGAAMVLLDTAGAGDVVLGEASVVGVTVEEGWVGPGVWVFLCDEVRCVFHGVVIGD